MPSIDPEDFSWRVSGDPGLGLTLGRLFDYMLGPADTSAPARHRDPADVAETTFHWPPDVFALCAATLRKSGCYAPIMLQEVKKKEKMVPEAELRDAAVKWRERAMMGKAERQRCPIGESPLLGHLFAAWTHLLCRRRDLALDLIRDDEPLVRELLNLLTTADVACAGAGLPGQGMAGTPRRREASPEARFFEDMMDHLTPGLHGSTLCRYVHPTVARVLPKAHVPLAGVTVRSFSRHLAYCEGEEVQPRWFVVPATLGRAAKREDDHEKLNILVVPWPPQLRPAQIRKTLDWERVAMRPRRKTPVSHGGKEERARHEDEPRHHLFTCASSPSASRVAEVVEALCIEADRKLGGLDAVVLPELAVSPKEYLELRARVLRLNVLLVCGVGRPAEGSEAGDNFLCMDIPLSEHHAVHFRQSKHHPWRLDSHQIKQYGLGGRLRSEDFYWEHINVNDRRLLFVVLRPWLVTCGLICEDLARHDPVGELVRSVGPNLVLALLMDGPQLLGRWPGRYATSLADDPGTSVLSVTSVGMSTMTEPMHGESDSRKVALWKDARGGARELPLDRGAGAIVLSLTMEQMREATADSRVFDADYPVLTGIHPVTAPEPRPTADPTLKAGLAMEAAAPKDPRWLSPNDAMALARLVHHHHESEKFQEILAGLEGEAQLIGLALRELRRRRGRGSIQQKAPDRRYKLSPGEWYTTVIDERHRHTARKIIEWYKVNQRSSAPATDV